MAGEAGEPAECVECGGQGEGGASAVAGTGSSDAPATNGGSAGQGGNGEPAPSSAGQAGTAAMAPAELSLRSVTVTQTLEVPLMQAGDAIGPAFRALPVVAGRRALVRAFVDVTAEFAARPLIGVLDVKTDDKGHALVSKPTISQSSLQDDLTTTFDFDVPAELIRTTTSYRVRVLEADTSPLLFFPEDGYAELGAKKVAPFALVLVPLVSNGFGPKTGSEQLDALKQRLTTLYPISEVEVTVAAPVTLNYVVNGDGDGWDPALDKIYELRSAAAPAQNVFYFGMLAPSESYSSYCTSGCTLGYSIVADADDIDSRGSIGVTVFQDGSGEKDAWDTLAHELGHAMGRDHAPCGISDPSDVDAAWPTDSNHVKAGLGVYGYDFGLSKLVKPRQYRDVMSYCSPVWISDYTYGALDARLDYIAAHAFRTLTLAPAEPLRLARIWRDGQSFWLGERAKNGAATPHQLDLLDAVGRRIGNIVAQVSRVDHARGGYVWLPAQALAKSGATSVDLRPLGGSVLAL
jgi:hypothetical protein